MSEQDKSKYDHLVGGYPHKLEHQLNLEATSTEPELLMLGDIPDEVDPRNHPEAGKGFLKVEMQGSIGACQGVSLTDAAEFACFVATGIVYQFSKMFSYLVSQMMDGIRSDSGSTLDGGTKAGRDIGFCPEEHAPYPSRYPGWGWVTTAMKTLAAKFKLKSHAVLRSADEIKRFIGSGIGIVQIGIAWGSAMDPDRDGCITRWSAGRGGHAVVFCGYVTDETVGRKSSRGYWLLLKNSWGERWGVKGYAYVDPDVVDQMLKHRFTVMVGRSDMQAPKPRPIPVDFRKASRFGKADPFLVCSLALSIGAILCSMLIGCGESERIKVAPDWVPPAVPVPDANVHCEAVAILRSELDEIHAGIREELDSLAAKSCQCSEPESPSDIELINDPATPAEPKGPVIGHKSVVMHTLPNKACPPCEIWKAVEKPEVEKAGIRVFVFEDAKIAPTFDLFNGKEYFKRITGYRTAKQILDALGVKK